MPRGGSEPWTANPSLTPAPAQWLVTQWAGGALGCLQGTEASERGAICVQCGGRSWVATGLGAVQGVERTVCFSLRGSSSSTQFWLSFGAGGVGQSLRKWEEGGD